MVDKTSAGVASEKRRDAARDGAHNGMAKAGSTYSAEVPQQNVVVPKLEDNLRAKLNVGSRVQASGQ